MKKFSRITRTILIAVAVVVCLTAIGSAESKDKEQTVFRAAYPGETHTGYLLAAWEPTVSIKESEKLAPIVVTWSGSYRATTGFYVGLRLNDGPCVFNGPSSIPAFFPADYSSTSVTLQWVFMPGDYKLSQGLNTITLCGGSSEWGSNGTIELGLNTMTARLER